MWSLRSVIVFAIGLAALAADPMVLLWGQARAKPSVPDAAAASALVNRSCVSCHNEKLRTADLLLDKANIADPSVSAEVWEKVIRKLQAKAMPPVGVPRPDPAALEGLVQYLQIRLDQSAAARLNPGRPADHRLNRTEYANAVRDLLELEIDTAALLPPDNLGYGFDNIADVLAVSPLLMERYMFAAGKVSRMAVGSDAARPVGETYNLSDQFMQDDRAGEDLPFGSRGGAALRHNFAGDGEYTIKVRLHKNLDGYIRGLRRASQLDVRLDDTRVKLFTIGGERKGRSGPIFSENQNPEFRGDLDQVLYEFTADEALETRFTAKAGIRSVAVTFLKRNARPEGVLKPPMMLSDIDHYKGGEPAIESVTITGPYNSKGSGETLSRRRIFTCQPSNPAGTSAADEACARQIISRLARRAYRRPVSSADVDELMSVYSSGRADGGFEAGVELAVQSILAGPEFLFRVEQEPAGLAPGSAFALTDLDLASRLSFFLWNSIPDDELLTLAESGKLRQPGVPSVLESQVKRMLADSRSTGLVHNFASQWLALRNVRQSEPDENRFPEFDAELKLAFERETELFVESMLREDRKVLELLTANYTFLNERLARHYGVPGIYGSRFRRVQLADPNRAGLLGQGSVLTLTSYNNRTSPVLRGKWVLETLIGMPPPPAPPNVPALEEKSKDGKLLTLRQQMEQHRANPACASCHKLMDPIGFALENYDAIGKWRTESPFGEADPKIDASGTLFDGVQFRDLASFRALLLSHSDRFVQTLTEKLLTYALGRGVEHTDMPAVRGIMKNAAASEYRWSALIAEIVKSPPFQMRRAR